MDTKIADFNEMEYILNVKSGVNGGISFFDAVSFVNREIVWFVEVHASPLVLIVQKGQRTGTWAAKLLPFLVVIECLNSIDSCTLAGWLQGVFYEINALVFTVVDIPSHGFDGYIIPIFRFEHNPFYFFITDVFVNLDFLGHIPLYGRVRGWRYMKCKRGLCRSRITSVCDGFACGCNTFVEFFLLRLRKRLS